MRRPLLSIFKRLHVRTVPSVSRHQASDEQSSIGRRCSAHRNGGSVRKNVCGIATASSYEYEYDDVPVWFVRPVLEHLKLMNPGVIGAGCRPLGCAGSARVGRSRVVVNKFNCGSLGRIDVTRVTSRGPK